MVEKKALRGEIAYYTRAIELDPTYAEAYYHRGKAHASWTGGLDNAVSDYSEAIRLKPDFGKAYLGRAKAYIWMNRDAQAWARAYEMLAEQLSEQIEGFGQADANASPEPETYWDEALGDLTKAIELGECNTAALIERSALYCELERFEEAIVDCDKAISCLDAQRRNLVWRSEIEEKWGLLGWSYGQAYLQRGKAYWGEHNTTQAFADFDQAIHMGGAQEAYLFRGALYYYDDDNGYRDEAREDLREYLKGGAGDLYKEQALEMLEELESDDSP